MKFHCQKSKTLNHIVTIFSEGNKNAPMLASKSKKSTSKMLKKTAPWHNEAHPVPSISTINKIQHKRTQRHKFQLSGYRIGITFQMQFLF